MVSEDDRRAVALARRPRNTPRAFTRRPVDSDFLPGPEPLEPEDRPAPPIRRVATDFVSISSSTVDSDLKRISDGATGDFKDEFTRDMPQVRAAVVENKVDSKGTVLRAAVVSGDGRTAVVLVAVDATVHNTNAPDGRLSHYRIQLSLVRDGGSGRWLVSQLQFVG